MNFANLEPLYPYTGGKGKCIKHFSKYLKYAQTYIEPFFGGGAVYCHMYNLGLAKRFIINDIREDIIGIYRSIIFDHATLYEEVNDLVCMYNSLATVGQKERMFYEQRDLCKTNYSSAKCLFLSISDFGGMPKISIDGYYRGTSGHNIYDRRIISLSKENIINWANALERTEICCGDFQKVPINHHDALIFCDPPYHASRIQYGLFPKSDQIRCFNWCVAASQNKNITVLLSNRDNNRFFSDRCGPDIEILTYRVAYSAGENVKDDEALFIWNRRK